MPRPRRSIHRVIADFDFVPKPGVVLALRAGDQPTGLPTRLVKHGLRTGKLELIEPRQKEKPHG